MGHPEASVEPSGRLDPAGLREALHAGPAASLPLGAVGGQTGVVRRPRGAAGAVPIDASQAAGRVPRPAPAPAPAVDCDDLAVPAHAIDSRATPQERSQRWRCCASPGAIETSLRRRIAGTLRQRSRWTGSREDPASNADGWMTGHRHRVPAFRDRNPDLDAACPGAAALEGLEADDPPLEMDPRVEREVEELRASALDVPLARAASLADPKAGAVRWLGEGRRP